MNKSRCGTINSPCGGRGSCGKCGVKITSGAKEASDADKVFFNEEQLRQGWRLACRTTVQGDIDVDLSEGVCCTESHKILERSFLPISENIAPSVNKSYIELSLPTLDDNRADRERVKALEYNAVGHEKLLCERI